MLKGKATMRKYAVIIHYPDLYAEGCPIVSVSYHIRANTPQEAEQKAFYYSLAAVKDMLKRTGESPYTIDIVAFELVKVMNVKVLEG